MWFCKLLQTKNIPATKNLTEAQIQGYIY